MRVGLLFFFFKSRIGVSGLRFWVECFFFSSALWTMKLVFTFGRLDLTGHSRIQVKFRAPYSTHSTALIRSRMMCMNDYLVSPPGIISCAHFFSKFQWLFKILKCVRETERLKESKCAQDPYSTHILFGMGDLQLLILFLIRHSIFFCWGNVECCETC